MKKVDLSGQRFNKLTVIREASEGKKRVHWECVCDCGNTVIVASNNLANGHTKSCGCHKLGVWSEVVTTHGLSRMFKAEYGIWKKMRARCKSNTDVQYVDYGGRGIKVDEAWESFEVFINDMGRRPTPKHSLNRIDNDGPYCKSNCEWATAKEQANNRRSSKFIEVEGELMTVAQASERFGIKYATLQRRLRRFGSATEAVRGHRT